MIKKAKHKIEMFEETRNKLVMGLLDGGVEVPGVGTFYISEWKPKLHHVLSVKKDGEFKHVFEKGKKMSRVNFRPARTLKRLILEG